MNGPEPRLTPEPEVRARTEEVEMPMYQTPLRKIIYDGSPATWVRASFGLHKLGDQAPYCSLTGEEYSSSVPTDRNMLSCGQIRCALLVAFPELKAFARWHLCTDGTPMHYIANAKYWHEMANGKVKRRAYDPEPRATFEEHCLIGAIVDLSASDLLAMPWERCEDELESRVPALRAAFKSEVVDKLEAIARALKATAI
jgi:hypothetical protein